MQKQQKASGSILLVPAPLMPEALHTLSPEVIATIHRTTYYIVENARTARRYIKSTNPPYAIESLNVVELDKHDRPDPAGLLKPAFHGNDIGIISEAGCPGIADPGTDIVLYAHTHGIRVVPLSGPSSIVLALMASGLNGQQFQFHGYLSPKKDKIGNDLKNLEEMSRRDHTTQIFIETPYRNRQVIEAAFKVLQPGTLFCIAADLTTITEYVRTLPVAQWKKMSLPDLHKRPSVFLISTQSHGILYPS